MFHSGRVGRPEQAKAPLASDVARAKTKVPRKQFKGKTFPHMSAKLNAILQRDPLVETRKCSEWSLDELHQLQTQLFQLRHGAFESIYRSAKDNRRLRAGTGGLAVVQREWEELKGAISASGSTIATLAHDILRDGHCHEAVMWYVHHLTTDVKAAIKGIEIPLLSEKHHSKDENGPCTKLALSRRLLADSAKALQKVCTAHATKTGCAACHADS